MKLCDKRTDDVSYKNHYLGKDVAEFKITPFHNVFSMLQCAHMCMIEEDPICRGADYGKSTNRCHMYTDNVYST